MTDRNPFGGMRLRCTECKPKRPTAFHKDGDPNAVCRCSECGKKHSTDSLEVI